MRFCRARAGQRDHRNGSDTVADCAQQRGGRCRWRRQRRHRHQAADAAAVDADIAVAVTAQRCGLAGAVVVADDAKRTGGCVGRIGSRGAEACKQARQRHGVSDGQRYDATSPMMPISVLGGRLAHSPFPTRRCHVMEHSSGK